MNDRLSIALLLFALSACAPEASQTPDVSASLDYKGATLPDHLVFSLANRSDRPVCLGNRQFGFGGGNLRFEGENFAEASANRPPESILNGVDVSDGMIVILPGRKMQHLVQIPRLDDAHPVRGSVTGTLVASDCEALFSERAPVAQKIAVRAAI